MTLASYSLTLPPLALALLIFLLRATDLTLGTLRVLAVFHGRRLLAWGLGFIGAIVFVTAIAGVLANLDNPLNILAYAAGFAFGNVLGMSIEARRAPGHSLMRIVSASRGQEIADGLHNSGRGATEFAARGLQGGICLVMSYMPRRQVPAARQLVEDLDPQAFVTVEQVRQLIGGWNA
jgi:uncharacterized protein YebE (UPF0316 family)